MGKSVGKGARPWVIFPSSQPGQVEQPKGTPHRGPWLGDLETWKVESEEQKIPHAACAQGKWARTPKPKICLKLSQMKSYIEIEYNQDTLYVRCLALLPITKHTQGCKEHHRSNTDNIYNNTPPPTN